MDWQRLNRDVIAEFRANGGRVERFGDLPLVILHTVAAESGATREVPLIVVPTRDGGEERLLLFGTAAGSKSDPRWVDDLRQAPRIEVEMGTERFEAEVREVEPSQRLAYVASMNERSDQFAGYLRSAAPREIPVFSIERSATRASS